MLVNIPVSIGELIDKITILEIKLDQIKNKTQLNLIELELAHLNSTFDKLNLNKEELIELKQQLKHTNKILWDIENFKRLCEQTKQFDDPFIQAARAVYLNNDLRAKIKKQINTTTGSTLHEVKHYTEYTTLL